MLAAIMPKLHLAILNGQRVTLHIGQDVAQNFPHQPRVGHIHQHWQIAIDGEDVHDHV